MIVSNPPHSVEEITHTMAVTDTIKDAAYVTIGFGVLGFQKAQVRRVELTKQLETQKAQLETQIAEGRKAVSGLAAQLEGYVAPYVTPIRSQIETGLDTVEAVLPTQVQE